MIGFLSTHNPPTIHKQTLDKISCFSYKSLTNFLYFCFFWAFFTRPKKRKKTTLTQKKFPQNTSSPGNLVYFEKISGLEVIREHSSTIWEGEKYLYLSSCLASFMNRKAFLDLKVTSKIVRDLFSCKFSGNLFRINCSGHCSIKNPYKLFIHKDWNDCKEKASTFTSDNFCEITQSLLCTCVIAARKKGSDRKSLERHYQRYLNFVSFSESG